MSEWFCRTCGAPNGPNDAACRTCGDARLRLPDSATAVAARARPPWRCAACENMNSGVASVCSACGSPPGPIASTVPPTAPTIPGIVAVTKARTAPAPEAGPTWPTPAPTKGRRTGFIWAGAAAAVALIAVIGILVIPSRTKTVYVPLTAGGSTTTTTSTTQPDPVVTTSTTAPGPQQYLAAGTEPGTAISLAPLTDDQQSAVSTIQALASALASQNWDSARNIYQNLSSSDSTLQSEYGALQHSTVVITQADAPASPEVLHGAYVAWEAVPEQRTSIYCVVWNVDTTQNVVVQAQSVGNPIAPYQSGWVSPNDPALLQTVQQQCT